jgi:hypothetical protein
MPQAPQTRRRWFQFGLGTLFVVVTIFAVWLGWELKFIRERQAFLMRAGADRTWYVMSSQLDGPITPRHRIPTIPFWRRWLGDEAVAIMEPPHGIAADEEIDALFPEANAEQ